MGCLFSDGDECVLHVRKANRTLCDKKKQVMIDIVFPEISDSPLLPGTFILKVMRSIGLALVSEM